MKKRILIILLSCVLLTSLNACNSKNITEEKQEGMYDISNNEESINDKETVNRNTQKFSGELYATTSFAEGIALATTSGNSTTVCIDKTGSIVFALDVMIDAHTLDGDTSLKFMSGLILLPDGRLCDNKGSITAPNDVGVTKFYDVALEGGYVIVEVIESTFDSTSKKIGVMNTNFEWIYEPSEELYPQVSIQNAVYSSDEYFDGYLYMDKNKTYWNLSTGEITAECPAVLPIECWQSYTDHTYRDISGNNIKLSLKDVANVYNIGRFIDDKAPIIYYNDSAKSSFYNYIDETGEFLFDPVKIFDDRAKIIEQDGNIVLIGGGSYLNNNHIKSYDDQGNLLGELDLSSLGSGKSWNVHSFEDGIVIVTGGIISAGRSSYLTYVYDSALKRLI